MAITKTIRISGTTVNLLDHVATHKQDQSNQTRRGPSCTRILSTRTDLFMRMNCPSLDPSFL